MYFLKKLCIDANMHLIHSSESLIIGSSLLQLHSLSFKYWSFDWCKYFFFLFIYSFLLKTTFLQKKRRKKKWWAKLLWIVIMSNLWQHCINKPGISRIPHCRLLWYPQSTASSLYCGNCLWYLLAGFWWKKWQRNLQEQNLQVKLYQTEHKINIIENEFFHQICVHL